MTAYRNPRPRSSTARHIAQQDRRREEFQRNGNRAAGLVPEAPISAEAIAAYDALLEMARAIERQRQNNGSAFGPAVMLKKAGQ